MSTVYLSMAVVGLFVSSFHGHPGVADAEQPAGNGAKQTAIATPPPSSETPAVPAGNDLPVPSRSLTRFQMEIYEVVLSTEAATALDIQRLAAESDSGKDFAAALKQLGETSLLFRMDQQADFAALQKVSIELNRPFVRGTQATKSGQVNSQVEYPRTGCEAEVRCEWDAASPLRGHVIAAIMFSGRSDSGIGIGNDIMAPNFYKVKQDFGGPIESGRPTALLTIDASHADGKAVARIVRITLSRSELE